METRKPHGDLKIGARRQVASFRHGAIKDAGPFLSPSRVSKRIGFIKDQLQSTVHRELKPTTLTDLRYEILEHIDGGPILSPKRIKNRFEAIREQVAIGLRREGKPTSADGGLLAIPTGNEDPATVWPDVQGGSDSLSYILDCGSTNWKLLRAEKNETDGTITSKKISTTVYPDDEVREITVSGFIDNMLAPFVEEYQERARSGAPDGAINIGIKFGFPHRNEEHDGRTDAIIIDVAPDGTYSKGWKFTDWDPAKEINVTKIMTERLQEQGINVASIVAKNDTNAVARDEDAAQKALAKRRNEREQMMRPGIEATVEPTKPELIVLDAGFVGGGGTNGAAKGGINLEIGRAKFIGEEDGEVHQKMKAMGLVKGDKVAEQETGAIIVSRVAATLALMEDKHLLKGGTKYARKLLEVAKTDQSVVDVIAYGEPNGVLTLNKANKEFVQDIARGELIRAGVNYGILIANTIAASLPEEGADPNVQYGLRTEGSVLLKGKGIKDTAVAVAQELLGLTYAPELIEADGNLGVAALAMSKKYFDLTS